MACLKSLLNNVVVHLKEKCTPILGNLLYNKVYLFLLWFTFIVKYRAVFKMRTICIN